MRKAVVAGSFYSSYKEKLKKEVGSYLSSKKDNAKAVISPHAGYLYSGRLAGDVINRINHKKDIILVGVNHSGIGAKINLSLEDFQTPLGIVKNNKALTNNIFNKIKKQGLNVEINEESHKKEHSLEVQLPFLQESQEKFEIVPILLSNLDYEDCLEIARVLSSFVDDNIGIVISSDFTHYGKIYGFVPFEKNIKERIYNLDGEIILKILKLKSREIYDMASKTTICGMYGITIITEIAKIKNLKPKVIDYYTSGDVTGDYDNVVGYAGIVFY
jgi:hypothetical protein